MRLKDLPIGTQTFSDIIQGNFVYVDKTKYLSELLHPEKATYFLSRPRRFGKSLTISTLEAIFLGKRDLFKELYIDSTGYDWKIHPVIRIDMSKAGKSCGDELIEFLIEQIRVIANQYKVPFSDDIRFSICFERLIRELSKQGKVVILIDEYDKPIIEYLTEPEKAAINREILKEFYTIIKASDEFLRFVFMTGVSKFSKVGVFSGLNNLQDLTMDTKYATMLGYTQEELETNFGAHIEALAKAEQISIPETLEKIRKWYNGYRFSETGTKVYNPFSTLLLFAQQRFTAHWFETGTPTFLVELIQKTNLSIEQTEEQALPESGFSTYEIENLDPLALLFQTGYLTIAEYNREDQRFKLGFPNHEVESSFLDHVLARFTEKRLSESQGLLYQLETSLKKSDLEVFFSILKSFFANVPYDIQLSNEKYYQSIFYMIFTLLGLHIQAEVKTNKGRIDAVIETKDKVYLFEFKLKGTAEEALQQIQTKEYAQKYKNSDKPIWGIGVEFDSKDRNIGRWVTGGQ